MKLLTRTCSSKVTLYSDFNNTFSFCKLKIRVQGLHHSASTTQICANSHNLMAQYLQPTHSYFTGDSWPHQSTWIYSWKLFLIKDGTQPTALDSSSIKTSQERPTIWYQHNISIFLLQIYILVNRVEPLLKKDQLPSLHNPSYLSFTTMINHQKSTYR